MQNVNAKLPKYIGTNRDLVHYVTVWQHFSKTHGLDSPWLTAGHAVKVIENCLLLFSFYEWRKTEILFMKIKINYDIVLFLRVSFGCCGRFTPAELLSLALSILFVSIWVFTGHWLLMDGKSLQKGRGTFFQHRLCIFHLYGKKENFTL